eukprot:scaffold52959_cov59-Phaeocystis_antarctica.AAC.13
MSTPDPTRPGPHTEPRPNPHHRASALTTSRPCAAVCTARGRHQVQACHLRWRRQEHRAPETQHRQGNDPKAVLTCMQHI